MRRTGQKRPVSSSAIPSAILRGVSSRGAWDSIAAVSDGSRGTPTLYVMGVRLREDQETASIVFFLDVLFRADFGIIDRLTRMASTLDAVAHHADVGVSGFNRPTGGFVRSVSMQVGAIEDKLRAFLGGQLFRHVILIVAG